MLGLKYGSVTLVPHDPSWQAAFGAEQLRLTEALAGVRCRIEHVGSTAIPGLHAKPIIDIAVGVGANVRIAEVVVALEGIGYQYRGDAKVHGGHIFVRESAASIRTHHVHVVDIDGSQWEDYVAFRDLLRNDGVARQIYGDEKQVLAERHAGNRQAYTAAKQEVIRRLLTKPRVDAT